MTLDDFISVLKTALNICLIGADKIVINRNIDDGLTIRILSDKTYKTIVIPSDKLKDNLDKLVSDIITEYLYQVSNSSIHKESVKYIKSFFRDKVITDV